MLAPGDSARPISYRTAWYATVLVALSLAAAATTIRAPAQEARSTVAKGSSAFRLFSGPTVALTGNQLQCGLNDVGFLCADVFDSRTGGGGFWPAGSPNQYIYNSGLVIAGVIGPDAEPWAGDTTGAFFFDPKGTTRHGTALTDIYDSLDPRDLERWPSEARIPDTEPFAQGDWGKTHISSQDTWVQYWDGDPARNAGRAHPLGVRVTQRTLAWAYPASLASLVYLLVDIENVSPDPEFQRLNETDFFGGENALPDEGYSVGDLYVGILADPDVSDATENFGTAILPFDMSISYHGGFHAPEFEYPPALFHSPFFSQAPGIFGSRFLSLPTDPTTGLPTELSVYSGLSGASFGHHSPGDVRQLWRYLSTNYNPERDNPCTVIATVTVDRGHPERALCWVYQESHDLRYYHSAGPLTLLPGDTISLVIAYVIAPAVQTIPDGTPSGIQANTVYANANQPGVPSFHPGFAGARGCTEQAIELGDAAGCEELDPENPVKPIEQAAGWVEYSGPPPSGRLNGVLETADNKLNARMVRTVPNSLLGRSQAALNFMEAGFPRPEPPERPAFYLIPADGSVTVYWEPSPTMVSGDPFHALATDPGSSLYNPNYRRYDVEGYRIWRGTSPNRLELIAQFDHADSRFDDYTCETVRASESIGARLVDPSSADTVIVKGFASGELCPVEGDPGTGRPIAPLRTLSIDTLLWFNNGSAGGVPGGGVHRLLNREAREVTMTAGLPIPDPPPPILAEGVPFVYTDNAVTNNFTYYYAVTAFDVNSPASAPASLASAPDPKAVTPRADVPGLVKAELRTTIYGDDGIPLDPAAPMPVLDPEAGTFAGPIPPTDGLDLQLIPLVERLLGPFTHTARIDSLVPAAVSTSGCPAGANRYHTCWVAHLEVEGQDESASVAVDGFTPMNWSYNPPTTTTLRIVELETPYYRAALDAHGIPSASATAAVAATFDSHGHYSSFEGYRTRFDGRTRHGGSRWLDGTVETVPDPARFVRVGHLEGIDSVWAPIHDTSIGPDEGAYPASVSMRCFPYSLAFLGRSADVRVTWTGGTITARDVTHNVDVPFDPNPRTSWGYLNTDGNENGMIDWGDFDYLDVVMENSSQDLGFCQLSGRTGMNKSRLEPTPTIQAVSTESGEEGVVAATVNATGQGFGLYINGERFIFQTAALPDDGTVWTLRTYSGAILTSYLSSGLDPFGYSFQSPSEYGATGRRPPTIAGLNMRFEVSQPATAPVRSDLARVHTVPDPYLLTSQYEVPSGQQRLMFVNLPSVATIRIYTVGGILVDILNHDDPTLGGRTEWDLRTRAGAPVASGVYFFHVVTPEGETRVGKFTVINRADP